MSVDDNIFTVLAWPWLLNRRFHLTSFLFVQQVICKVDTKEEKYENCDLYNPGYHHLMRYIDLPSANVQDAEHAFLPPRSSFSFIEPFAWPRSITETIE